jgi:antitoxin VapB
MGIYCDIPFLRGGFPMESTAKIFQNGRSQAVRLPKAFRFKGSEVKIKKEGDKVILEPLAKDDWPRGFWDEFVPDPDFAIPEPLPSKEFSLD